MAHSLTNNEERFLSTQEMSVSQLEPNFKKFKTRGPKWEFLESCHWCSGALWTPGENESLFVTDLSATIQRDTTGRACGRALLSMQDSTKPESG